MKSQESSIASQLDVELRNLPTPTLCAVAATLLSNSLKSFTREAWHLVESEPFIGGWYWTTMCEYLTAVTQGRIKRHSRAY